MNPGTPLNVALFGWVILGLGVPAFAQEDGGTTSGPGFPGPAAEDPKKKPKEPKAEKAPKEPKAEKAPKEPKAEKAPKEPKAEKAPKEPKADVMAEDPAPPDVAAPEPVGASSDPGPLPAFVYGEDQAPMGIRINAYGSGSGAFASQAFVLGANGGTAQTNLRARWASPMWGLQIGLPVVVSKLPRQPRDVGLGNLQVDAWRRLGSGEGYTAIGLEAHANLGVRSYTWTNDADEVWPGFGADLVVQDQRGNGRLTRMARVAVGGRWARDYDPWRGQAVSLEVAYGLDFAASNRFGLVGEMSLTWWDLSPWDLVGLARVDLAPGVRARAGAIAPIGVWAGITEIDPDLRGVRETTLVFDLSLTR
jgi:hypothetical protein